MLEKEVLKSEQATSALVQIWKVFATLMEYCCRVDYKTMIIKI